MTRSPAEPPLPDLDGVRHDLVEIAAADGPLRVHVAEAGSGEPVLLLHGWPQHWWCWRGVIPPLAERYRVIAPDLRGFGWSEAPARGYDPETFAADQVALLDALGIGSARVMGHDWGGFASFLLALRHPERVERLVAINTPVPWARATPRGALQAWRSWYAVALAAPLAGRLLLERRPGFVARALRRDAVHDGMSPDDARAYAELLREPARAAATTALYRSYLRAFAGIAGGRYRGLRLTRPGLLLFGARDAYVWRELIRGFEPYADDLRVELVEDSGHFLPDERPELVAERALAHFAG